MDAHGERLDGGTVSHNAGLPKPLGTVEVHRPAYQEWSSMREE
jgi:hypothetical protein